MTTSSNGNIILVISPLRWEFPSQRLVTGHFDVFFDLVLNKRLSKQTKRWWFEMPLCSLWRPCNANKWCFQKLPHLYTSGNSSCSKLNTNVPTPDPVPVWKEQSVIFNSLRPSDAIWRHRSGSTLAQVMACCLDGTKPLTEPMLTYYQLGLVASHLRVIS